VKTTLDALAAKRDEAVDRSSRKRAGPPAPHLITKDKLKKTVNFLKSLAEATEEALWASPPVLLAALVSPGRCECDS
jgi:hypothetical protein